MNGSCEQRQVTGAESAQTTGSISQPVLLALDVDRTQEYVYESARLPEVRGASALLDDLNSAVGELLEKGSAAQLGEGCPIPAADDRQRFRKDDAVAAIQELQERFATAKQAVVAALETPPRAQVTVVYTGGGSLLAKVEVPGADAEQAVARADEIGRALCAVYEQVTLVASATHAVGPYEPQNFAECFRLLSRRLRRAKDAKAHFPNPQYLPGPGDKRCTSCDLRKGVGTYHRPSAEAEEPRQICWACKTKNDARVLGRLRGKLSDRRPEWGSGDRSPDFAPDLDHIAQCSTTKPYIGVIYMDGDGMGRTLEKVAEGGPEALGEFSRALQTALEDATLEAVADLIQRFREEKDTRQLRPESYHPLQILYIGGDDLVLIVPADQALDLVCAVQEKFAKSAAALPITKPRDLTLSAGVVISHSHYPMYFLHRLAKELCRSAKRRGPGSVDFEVLRSASAPATDAQGLRARLQVTDDQQSGHVERRTLTYRPYQWFQLRELLDTVRKLRAVGYPKGQLIALAQHCRGNRLDGSSFFMYQLARADREARQVLESLVNDWCAADPPPWQKLPPRCCADPKRTAQEYRTPLGDLADLYDIVRDRRGAETQ